MSRRKVIAAGVVAAASVAVFATLRPAPVYDTEATVQTGCGDYVCEAGEGFGAGGSPSASWCPVDCQPTLTQQRPTIRLRTYASLRPVITIPTTGAGPWSGSTAEADWSVTSEGGGFWTISLTAKVLLREVHVLWLTPTEASTFVPLNNPTDNDFTLLPYLGGVAEEVGKRVSFAWFPGSSDAYPGGEWAPMMVAADPEYAQVMADVSWPRKSGIVAQHALQQYALTDYNDLAIGASRSWRVLIRKVRGNADYPPWAVASDLYRRWLHTHQYTPTIPDWARNADGFVYLGLSNDTNYSCSEVNSKFDESKARFPWLQMWGQMSTYAGDPNLISPAPAGLQQANFASADHTFSPPVVNAYVRKSGVSAKVLKYRLVGDVADRTANITANGWLFTSGANPKIEKIMSVAAGTTVSSVTGFDELTGCCLYSGHDYGGIYETPFFHPRYTDLDSCITTIRGAGYHAGYYTRPAPTDPNFDGANGQEWIETWFGQSRSAAADAHYIDTFARNYYGDAVPVVDYLDTLREADEAIINEGFVDVYPTIGLWDGYSCTNPSYTGQITDADFTTCSNCLAPEFGRVALGGRLGFLGFLNDENDCAGLANGYKAERHSFLLGLKQIVNAGSENEIHTAIHAARAAVNWWARRPRYVHTLGLGTQPSGIRVRRHIDQDGVTLLAVDNPAAASGQSITVLGQTVQLPSSAVSVVEVP